MAYKQKETLDLTLHIQCSYQIIMPNYTKVISDVLAPLEISR